MSILVNQTIDNIKILIKNSIKKSFSNGLLCCKDIAEFDIETPADRHNGDFSSNIALISAKIYKLSPKKIAEIILSNISFENSLILKAEVAGPGFLNFYLNSDFYLSIIRDIEKLGSDYGKSNFGKNKKVMIEFVSANPTGPMHMGNARGGALGDCLAAILEVAGFDVYREFYINDAGNQIKKFAISLDIRYQQIFSHSKNLKLPEDSYHGEDINDLAKKFAKKYGNSFVDKDELSRHNALVEFALPFNILKMKNDMKKYRIKYDNWFKESTLYNSGEIEEILKILKSKGLIYKKDKALWYKATKFNSEKDEVLVRSNGSPTYFLTDIAYHKNKFESRKFDKCINVWGADHHGHVARLKGAMDAINLDSSKLDIVLMQLVKLVKNGELVKMSKRTGKAIQLSDLLEEVPIDAARFLFNMRDPNSQMEFDLDIAIKEDSQNPVYYVQYAFARICSILKLIQKEDKIKIRNCTDEELKLLNSSTEIELLKHLSAYTNEIIISAQNYDPAKITRYVINLANLFHKFYNECHVRGNDESLTQARITLCICVKTIIKNILTMFKITTPELM